MQTEQYDSVIIGGGPAGLTAAIYLARFHLKALVIDAGNSRAASIPKTRNHAGFPDGIAGTDLLQRMARQAEMYGARIVQDVVTKVGRHGDTFSVETAATAFAARTILLATGVVNRRPPMSPSFHDKALAGGFLRYCPICDGFEVTDQRIGVVGTGEHGVSEALFLRSFTAEVTLIAPNSEHELHPAQARQLEDAGVVIVGGPAAQFAIDDRTISVQTANGRLEFASIYPALGSDIISELAVSLGAQASAEGCLVVDTHQRTTVIGLFAAGDVVLGLDQISHAMGEGGVAATTIRNDLAKHLTLYRQVRG